MCSIVYSSYLSINSEVKDSRKKNTKTEIKHILHFPHVSKKHQLASPLLAEAGMGEMSAQCLARLKSDTLNHRICQDSKRQKWLRPYCLDYLLLLSLVIHAAVLSTIFPLLFKII